MMDVDYYGWVEMVFVGAIALGFGGWQLISINREIARDKEKRAAKRAADRHADASAPGHPIGEHPLDDR